MHTFIVHVITYIEIMHEMKSKLTPTACAKRNLKSERGFSLTGSLELRKVHVVMVIFTPVH